MIGFIKKNPDITLAGILENWRDTKFQKRLFELASDEDEFKEIGVTEEVFVDAINGLIVGNEKKFETFKTKKSPVELTEKEREKYREMQKTSEN